MSYITNLKCRECGQEYPIKPLHVCETCFGPLEVTYDYARIRAEISRRTIESRPHNLWRYRELLPVEGEPDIGPNSGFTPLLRAWSAAFPSRLEIRASALLRGSLPMISNPNTRTYGHSMRTARSMALLVSRTLFSVSPNTKPTTGGVIGSS